MSSPERDTQIGKVARAIEWAIGCRDTTAIFSDDFKRAARAALDAAGVVPKADLEERCAALEKTIRGGLEIENRAVARAEQAKADLEAMEAERDAAPRARANLAALRQMQALAKKLDGEGPDQWTFNGHPIDDEIAEPLLCLVDDLNHL